jgi:hypothetical protein
LKALLESAFAIPISTRKFAVLGLAVEQKHEMAHPQHEKANDLAIMW